MPGYFHSMIKSGVTEGLPKRSKLPRTQCGLLLKHLPTGVMFLPKLPQDAVGNFLQGLFFPPTLVCSFHCCSKVDEESEVACMQGTIDGSKKAC